MGAPAASAVPETAADETPSIAEIYERHADFVWRVVRRHGIPDAAAQDVMHEVFIVAHRRLPEYDARASVATWLFHIARGVASNYKRARARERGRLLQVASEPTQARDDPEAGTARREAAAFVRAFLAGLDDAKRDVFELVELEGMPVPEVARSLGLNLNTAYSRLRLARVEFSRAVLARTGRGA